MKKKKKVSFNSTIEIIPPYISTDSESYNDDDINNVLN